MPDTLDILRKLALQIRNASSEGENTAERVGRTLVGILNLLSKYSPEELEKIFLRKDRADGTPFPITFGDWVKFGEFISGISGGCIDKNGILEMEEGILDMSTYYYEANPASVLLDNINAARQTWNYG